MAGKLKVRKFIVVVREKILLPHRSKPDDVDRGYTTGAKTKRGAISNVRNAGIKGRIIDIREDTRR